MRRLLLLGLLIAALGLLAGCTGTGLFFDHTFNWFGENPNTPGGESEMFSRIRGQRVSVEPILPETGNVWPGPQKPDPTLDELSRQQAADSQRGAAPIPPATGATVPRPTGPTGAPVGPSVAPNGPRGGISSPQSPVVQTPGGPAIDIGGGSGRGYRQLQTPNQQGQSILVPNGNGTSTLINPNGTIETVPTRP